MLKFFRRIRQKLIAERNLKKYLLYAIGEVLLIIIGILLALQLSNLNEGAKEDKLANQYLERLLADLTKDTTYYSLRIKAARQGVDSTKVFIRDLYQTQQTEEEARRLFRNFELSTDPATTHNPAYLELSSTGKLSIITPSSLKEAIANYYRLNEELAANIEEVNSSSNGMLPMLFATASVVPRYMMSSFTDDSSGLSDDDWKFLNDPSSKEFQMLEGMALIIYARNWELSSHFDRLDKAAKSLMNQIKEKLEQ